MQVVIDLTNNRKISLLEIINYTMLTIGAIILLAPIAWMFSLSLKSMTEIMSGSQSWIPQSVHFENYIKTWQAAPFAHYTMNTVFITFFAVIGNVLVNTLMDYGFAKIK